MINDFKNSLLEAANRQLAYTKSLDLTTIPTASEGDFLLFGMGSATRSQGKIVSMSFGTNSQSIDTYVRVYKNSTFSEAGNPVDLSNSNISTSVGARSPKMSMFLAPTITDRGTLLNTFVIPQGSPTQKFDVLYLMEPSNSSALLITLENTLINPQVHVDLEWIEIPRTT